MSLPEFRSPPADEFAPEREVAGDAYLRARPSALQAEHAVELPRSWRSVFGETVLFFVLSALSISLSAEFPGSVYVKPLGPLAIHIPLLSLAPGALLLRILFLMYNSEHEITPTRVRTITGLCWIRRRLIEIEYELIMGVEIRQSAIDRLLGVGNIYVGTSMTGRPELSFDGILDAEHYANIIDSRAKMARSQFAGTGGFLFDD